jgi:hypothetical protein
LASLPDAELAPVVVVAGVVAALSEFLQPPTMQATANNPLIIHLVIIKSSQLFWIVPHADLPGGKSQISSRALTLLRASILSLPAIPE